MCALLALSCLLAAGEDRAEFATKMRQIELGDSKERVKALLGMPEKTTPAEVESGTRYPDSDEVWYYGLSQHGFPTLGRIYFGPEKGISAVKQVFGARAPAPAMGRFPEGKLRELVAGIAAMPDSQAGCYDPVAMIRAVNLVQGHTKPEIIALVEEYVRVTSPHHNGNEFRVQLYLRALCEPDGDRPCPPVNFGAIDPAAPRDLQIAPQYPLFVLGDVPLLLPHTSAFEGEPPSIEDEIAWFRERGVVRRRPFRPTLKLWELREKLEQSPAWTYCERKAADRLEVNSQLLFLIGEPTGKRRHHPLDRLYELSKPAGWAQLTERLRRENWAWNEAKEAFLPYRSAPDQSK